MGCTLACDPAPVDSSAPEVEPPRPSRCEDLLARTRDEARAAWVYAHACEGSLDARGQARLVSSIAGPDEAAALLGQLGDDPEHTGVARLIAGRFDGTPPEHIDNPSAAVVFPIDDRVLAQVGRAYRLLWAPGHPLSDRQWAHAYLAKVHLHALQSLPQEQPLSPAYVWLAGRVVHHGRRAVANVHRSPKSIAPFIAGLEPEIETLHERLDAAPHHGDPLLVAVERQRYREQREAPLRVADIERLVQQDFADWAAELAAQSDEPARWLSVAQDRAEARGLELRAAPPVVPDAGAEDGSATSTGESTGAAQPSEPLEPGPSFPAAADVAHRVAAAFEAATDRESKRIAIADAAWTLARRPDVAAQWVARHDALGALAQRFVADRGEATLEWRLDGAEDPSVHRRVRFSQTRP